MNSRQTTYEVQSNFPVNYKTSNTPIPKLNYSLNPIIRQEIDRLKESDKNAGEISYLEHMLLSFEKMEGDSGKHTLFSEEKDIEKAYRMIAQMEYTMQGKYSLE